MFLTEIRLPEDTPGRLFRSCMPGSSAPLASDMAELLAAGIREVICLSSALEIKVRCPEYGEVLVQGSLPCHVDQELTLEDYGVPKDEVFPRKLGQVVQRLRLGERVLVHCRAGVGRTGLFCICILRELGCTLEVAEQWVLLAGARPEAKEQWEFVRQFVPPT